MSKLETITIDTPSGSNTMQIGSTNTATINLGVSGDTINVPAGVTIANAGTATGFGESNTPYFDVKTSGDQTLNHNTVTKISFNTELQDSANAFDSSTNYRFTPQTAGRYLIYASLSYYHSGTVLSDARTYIYKNGSAYRQSSGGIYSGQFSYWNFATSSIIEFNGSSDYVEVYGQVLTSDGGTASVSEGRVTYFGGFRIAT